HPGPSPRRLRQQNLRRRSPRRRHRRSHSRAHGRKNGPPPQQPRRPAHELQTPPPKNRHPAPRQSNPAGRRRKSRRRAAPPTRNHRRHPAPAGAADISPGRKPGVYRPREKSPGRGDRTLPAMTTLSADKFSLSDERFSRLRAIEWWDQQKVATARILVIGAGALGNEVIKNLALLGVGHILIVD